MRRFILVFVMASLGLVVFFIPVSAGSVQEQPGATSPATRQEQTEALRQEALDRIDQTTQTILLRMDIAMTRLDRLTSRLASRSAAIAAAGRDTTIAESLLGVAEERLRQTRFQHAAMVTATENLPEQAYPRTAIERVVRELPMIEDELVDTLGQLKDTASALKQAEKGGGNGRATSSAGTGSAESGSTE